jgi:Bacterial regulatory proteins, luxR family
VSLPRAARCPGRCSPRPRLAAPNPEIAFDLQISPQTVHTHVANIRGKLGVRSKRDLVGLADLNRARHGLRLKYRDVPVPALGHDLRYVHAVVAGGEEVGLACAGCAVAPEAPRTRHSFPGADINGVGCRDRLRRRPFAGRKVDPGRRDLAGAGPLRRGGLDGRLCGAGRRPRTRGPRSAYARLLTSEKAMFLRTAVMSLPARASTTPMR